MALIERAYEYAATAHAGQRRKSGEPYIFHPIATARILAEMQLDPETIAAALLHDVIEDTGATSRNSTAEFGARVAKLVDGVTKLGQTASRISQQDDDRAGGTSARRRRRPRTCARCSWRWSTTSASC